MLDLIFANGLRIAINKILLIKGVIMYTQILEELSQDYYKLCLVPK